MTATAGQYAALTSALSALTNSLSDYINDQNSTREDIAIALSVENSIAVVSIRISQFQLSQLDGAKLDAATTAVQTMNSSIHPKGGPHVPGEAIARAWANARPAINDAIPGVLPGAAASTTKSANARRGK
jgi:hypothetical protein